MSDITQKSYPELCAAILGKNAFKVADLSESDLYRMSNSLELSRYGLTDKESERLLATIELSKRMFCQAVAKDVIHVGTPCDLAQLMMPKLRYLTREQFWVIGLNSKNMVLNVSLMSQGTLTNAVVHPREVFEPLILNHAAAFCVAHNHPSGDCSPSKPDKELTTTLQKAGEVMGIPLLDHAIIGDGCYYSFQEDNFFEEV